MSKLILKYHARLQFQIFIDEKKHQLILRVAHDSYQEAKFPEHIN